MRTVLALAAIALAGCGGSSGGSSDGPQTPEQTFAGTCGSCHTLSDAGTSGTFGPNLDDLKPDAARVRAAIEAGPGGMPGGLLDGKKADDVAAYVAGATGG